MNMREIDKVLKGHVKTPNIEPPQETSYSSLMQSPSRMEEIKEMWVQHLQVPNDMSKEEVIQFWCEMDYPHSARVMVVKEFAKKFNIRTLIETGTYEGTMVQECLDTFDQIISIEVNHDLFLRAKHKFSSSPHVTLLHGDSGEILPALLETINEPCLFWLDGHYVSFVPTFDKGSLDTPIWAELNVILNHSVQNHVTLIDDARCYIGPNEVSMDYPTIQEIREFVDQYPHLLFEVQPSVSDIIRIYSQIK